MAILRNVYSIEELSKLPVPEIEQIIENAAKAKAIAARAGSHELLEEFKALAEARGISIDDVMSEAYANTTVKPKLPAKFIHPDDPSKRWAGRGLKPKWMAEWLENGGSMDDLRV